MSMGTRRWINQTQPQTLQIAVFLMYLDAVFLAVFGGVFSLFGLLFIAGYVASGYGIANERKWGYGLAIASAFLPFIARLVVLNNLFAGFGVIGLLFAIIIIVVLLHPQSREYARIWFK